MNGGDSVFVMWQWKSDQREMWSEQESMPLTVSVPYGCVDMLTYLRSAYQTCPVLCKRIHRPREGQVCAAVDRQIHPREGRSKQFSPSCQNYGVRSQRERPHPQRRREAQKDHEEHEASRTIIIEIRLSLSIFLLSIQVEHTQGCCTTKCIWCLA